MFGIRIVGTPKEVMEEINEMVRVDEEITLDKRMSEADDTDRSEIEVEGNYSTYEE